MFSLCSARQPIRAQREWAGRSSSSANQKPRKAPQYLLFLLKSFSPTLSSWDWTNSPAASHVLPQWKKPLCWSSASSFAPPRMRTLRDWWSFRRVFTWSFHFKHFSDAVEKKRVMNHDSWFIDSFITARHQRQHGAQRFKYKAAWRPISVRHGRRFGLCSRASRRFSASQITVDWLID